MKTKVRASLVGSALFALCLLGGCAAVPAPPSAPVPYQISHATKVFLANAGGIRGVLDPDRAYNKFYQLMQASGRFTIVATPSQADIEVAIGLSSLPAGRYELTFVTADITDPATRSQLWSTKEQFVVGPIDFLTGRINQPYDDATVSVFDTFTALSQRNGS